MRSKDGRSLGLGAVLAALLYSSLAFAWKSDTPFEVHVHHHLFDRAVLENNDCTIDTALYFTAPKKAYSDPDASKNFFRFHARVKFASGQMRITHVFGNRAPGRRVYRTQIDTTSEGCWGKFDPKLAGVDVEGCRGRGCTPRDFE